jgi:hypothetical protein
VQHERIFHIGQLAERYKDVDVREHPAASRRQTRDQIRSSLEKHKIDADGGQGLAQHPHLALHRLHLRCRHYQRCLQVRAGGEWHAG